MSDETTPQNDAAMSPASAGSVGEPVAWAVQRDDGEVVDCWMQRQNAVNKAKRLRTPATVIPLYTASGQQQPVLTDRERAALNRAGVAYELLPSESAEQVSAALLGLLERLG